MSESGDVQSVAPPGNERPRRAPLIIRVPAPERAGSGSKTLWFALGTLAVAAAIAFVVVAVMARGWAGLVIAGLALLAAAGIVIAVAQVQRHRRTTTVARRVLGQLPEESGDPVAAALARKWKRPGWPVGANVVLEAIRAAPIPKPPRARIVCLGALDVPEVGELRFEPVIITPTRFLWKRLWFVPVALAIFGLWLLQTLHVLPIPGRVPLGSFAYFLCMGVAIAAVWVWRTTLNPTYLRLAPGVVQIIEFGLGKSKPNIRSYPMAPGTVAIVQSGGAGGRLRTVTLACGERIDEIPLWQMGGRADASERLWQALLSTAPTPPLSEDELLG